MSGLDGASPVAREPSESRWLAWLFSGCVLVAVVLVVLLLQRLAAIVGFPWDTLLWSESTFMTNMMKLDAGQPVYTAPERTNSFVYAPGLEFVAWAVLAPFDAHLDIRWCRALSVGLGGVTLVLCWSWLRKAGAAVGGWVGALAGLVMLLFVFREEVVHTTHPDSLYQLHAVGVLLLLTHAMTRGQPVVALAAALLAGAGVLVKQTAALSVLGVCVPVLFGARFGLRTKAMICASGLVATILSLWLLWLPEYGRFYTFELPLAHGIEWPKLGTLLTVEVLQRPFRLLLWVLAPWALWRQATHGSRAVAWAWGAVFVCEALPASAAYLKSMGLAHNLHIIDLFALLVVWPAFDLPKSCGRWARVLGSGWAKTALAVVVLVASVPRGAGLGPRFERYGRQLQRRVSADVRAGRRVLVAHGAMFYIRAGVRRVPLDRSQSYVELVMAGQADRSAIRARIRTRFYDRIYFNGLFFGDELIQLAREHDYVPVHRVPDPNRVEAWTPGYQWNMRSVLIMRAERPEGTVSRS